MFKLFRQKRFYLLVTAMFLAVFVLSGCSHSAPKIIIENQPETFKGNDCTSDCSGHEAGYDWAEEKGITDPSNCGGNSNSFIEGCESYAEEQQ